MSPDAEALYAELVELPPRGRPSVTQLGRYLTVGPVRQTLTDRLESKGRSDLVYGLNFAFGGAVKGLEDGEWAHIDRNADPGPRPTGLGAVPGGEFVLDGPVELEARWGADDAVLWARGEPLLICGPTGVGKTTLTLQLVTAMAGIGRPDVLGFPVARARRTLYLALDRPRQIRRAMARIFRAEHRAALDDRLVVWAGPLPGDLGRNPDLLLELAAKYDADAVIIDSLKDAAVKLSDDEVGGTLNRSIQLCVASGVDVAALHHQRKSQGGERPRTVEDVYGSTWLTAGAGSVVLLWGAPGDPLVELVHLKQPAAEVGPLKVEHDHVAGTSTVNRGFDLLAFMRLRGQPVTAMDVARAQFERPDPNDSQRLKATRLLDGLAKRGHVVKVDARRGGDGGTTAANYALAARLEEVA